MPRLMLCRIRHKLLEETAGKGKIRKVVSEGTVTLSPWLTIPNPPRLHIPGCCLSGRWMILEKIRR